MLIKNKLLLSILCVFLFPVVFLTPSKTFSQVAVGQWRDFLPYTNGAKVCLSDNKVYCATDVSLFYLNKIDYSLTKLSKLTGLSEIGFSSINYIADKQTLIIGYSSGNIDLIANNKIYNIPDIKRKQLTGLKTINSITEINGNIYLSCAFGIVVLNIDKKEIADTYYIGNFGGMVNVNRITADNQFIYAATDQGIFKASLTNQNLSDYNNWSQITNIQNYNKRFNAIAYFNQMIYANYSSGTSNGDQVYVLNNGSWQNLSYPISFVRDIKVSGNKIIIVGNTVEVFDQNNQHYTESPAQGRDAVIDDAGTMWIADAWSGLLKKNPTENFVAIAPNGPSNNYVMDISIVNGNMWVAPGGRDASWSNIWNPGALYNFNNNTWTNYSQYGSPLLTNTPDIVCVTINPQNPNDIFAGSWDGGVIEILNNTISKVYNSKNSSLQSIFSTSEYTRISSITFDKNNNMWVVNSGVSSPISVRTKDGKWYHLNYGSYITSPNVGKLIVTRSGDKWVFLPNGFGLLAFNENGTYTTTSDDKFKTFNVVDKNGTAISNNIYSMAEDLDGNIWVGTDQGVVVYYNETDVFNSGTLPAQQIIIQSQVGDTIPKYLLQTETVTAIAVDGANRKWFGTANAGVFLMSSDGTKQLQSFNVDNSPIISNNITSIAIDQQSGEVFFGTDKGIVSYRGTATQGGDFFNNVYAFPNPVRPGYNGIITIKGLVTNVNVKITDIIGNIVFETTALGGQAIWDGHNFSGQKVHTGVYLVFCTNDDGSKTYVTKILFIN